jgi:hypothetical protein
MKSVMTIEFLSFWCLEDAIGINFCKYPVGQYAILSVCERAESRLRIPNKGAAEQPLPAACDSNYRTERLPGQNEASSCGNRDSHIQIM